MSASSLRSRRFAQRQSEKIHSFIIFDLAEQSFALPLAAAQQVFPYDHPQPHPQDPTAYLARFQDRDLQVVDLGDRWLGQPTVKSGGNLLILALQDQQGDRLGILLSSSPRVHPVPESALTPMDKTDPLLSKIPCLGDTQIHREEGQISYTLDVDQLLQAHRV